MTYQEVITFFRNTSNEVGQNFVHGKIPDASFFSINTQWPLVILPPFREKTDYKKSIIERSIVLLFFVQDNPGNTTEERESLIADVYFYKEDFISNMISQAELPTSDYFGVTFSEILATPEYGQLAGYASGYSASFTLKSKIKC